MERRTPPTSAAQLETLAIRPMTKNVGSVDSFERLN